jgi:hypothetical protein
MHLVFSYVHPTKPSRTLGPFPSIWLDVEGMRSEAGSVLLAPYKEHQWCIDEEKYFRLDCTARVRVHFVRSDTQALRHDTFERFSAVNGLAYGDDKVIAFLDYKQNEWLYFDTGYHWPTMIVTAI